MGTRALSTGKLTLLLTAILAGILAFTNTAEAITSPLTPIGSTSLAIKDQHELGQVRPPTPEGDAAITQYVNVMIGLSLGGSGHVSIGPHDNLVTRSLNSFGTLPSPATVALRGTGTTIDLSSQGTYTYLFAHYGGPRGGFAEVWYVANLGGNIKIPSQASRYGLSGWALFTGPNGVPDGGATVMMLSSALVILGVVRRYLPH